MTKFNGLRTEPCCILILTPWVLLSFSETITVVSKEYYKYSMRPMIRVQTCRCQGLGTSDCDPCCWFLAWSVNAKDSLIYKHQPSSNITTMQRIKDENEARLVGPDAPSLHAVLVKGKHTGVKTNCKKIRKKSDNKSIRNIVNGKQVKKNGTLDQKFRY